MSIGWATFLMLNIGWAIPFPLFCDTIDVGGDGVPSKQNTKKIEEWKRNNVTRIHLELRNDSGLPERIQQAVDAGLAKSRQAYILDAVRDRLDADGIPKPEE